MQFLMTFNEPPADFAKRENPDASGPYWAAWTAYMGSIAQSAIMVSAAGLHPPHTASTVRMTDGARAVHDGPFADTKEQLGGFCLIEVENLDAALDWAAKAPSAIAGSVEVRPVLPAPE